MLTAKQSILAAMQMRCDWNRMCVGRVFFSPALPEMSHRGQLADTRRAKGRGVLAF